MQAAIILCLLFCSTFAYKVATVEYKPILGYASNRTQAVDVMLRNLKQMENLIIETLHNDPTIQMFVFPGNVQK